MFQFKKVEKFGDGDYRLPPRVTQSLATPLGSVTGLYKKCPHFHLSTYGRPNPNFTGWFNDDNFTKIYDDNNFSRWCSHNDDDDHDDDDDDDDVMVMLMVVMMILTGGVRDRKST